MIANDNVTHVKHEQKELHKFQVFAGFGSQVQVNAIVQSIMKSLNFDLKTEKFSRTVLRFQNENLLHSNQRA